MKRTLALILVVALCFSLGACTNRPDEAGLSRPDSSADASPAPETGSPAQSAEVQPSPSPSADVQPAPEPAAPTESPEPSGEPEKEPEENVNDGKLDANATVSSTATDLGPADSSFLALIPELPFAGWASTALDDSSVLLELSPAPGDCQAKLLDYIKTLREKGFEITEYSYGSFYDAEKDGVALTFMLEGGKLSLIIEKK